MTLAGFPHSGISGSTPTCGSPRLFAACRALLRLSVPRHPPCALVRLTGCPPPRPTVSRRGERGSSGPPLSFRTYAWCSRLLDAFPNFDPIPGFSIPTRVGGVLSQMRSTCEPFGRPGATYSRLQKGGDPAAGSPTATLLRLRPSHRARLRRLPPASGLGHRLRALPTPMA